MSVLVTVQLPADADQFHRFQEAEGDRLRQAGETARAAGCIHHRFGLGDGFVLAIDEWDSAESFQGFFDDNEELGRLIQDAGGRGEPTVTFAEALQTPDEF